MSAALPEGDVCPGCGHSLASHYRDVRGVARCMVVDHGVSSSGIIGEPYHYGCDCTEFRSEHAERQKEEERQKEREWQGEFDRTFGKFLDQRVRDWQI